MLLVLFSDEARERQVSAINLLALLGVVLRLVVAVEELAVEELDTHHGKDEKEKDVDNENVEHIFERDHNTVEHSLERWNAIDHFQRPQYTKQLHRLQLLTHGSTPEKDQARSY